MNSPIERAFDRTKFVCTVCGASMGKCDCWTKCPERGCKWSYRKGGKCRNPECPSQRSTKKTRDEQPEESQVSRTMLELETEVESDCSCEGIDSDTGLHTLTCVSRLREYHFDRFRNGRQMAQGAIVNAITENEALAKAHALYRECPNDTFRLRPDDPNEPFRWICIHCNTVSGMDDQHCLGCGKARYPLTQSNRGGK